MRWVVVSLGLFSTAGCVDQRHELERGSFSAFARMLSAPIRRMFERPAIRPNPTVMQATQREFEELMRQLENEVGTTSHRAVFADQLGPECEHLTNPAAGELPSPPLGD